MGVSSDPSGYTISIGLIENLIPYSESFVTGTDWNSTAFPVTVTPDAIDGPFPNTRATFITQTGSWGLCFQNINVSLTGTGALRVSVYAYPGTTNSFTLNGFYAGDGEVNVTYTLTGNGSYAGYVNAGIEKLSNGWYRCWHLVPARASTIYDYFAYRIWPDARASNTSNGMYFFGAQISTVNAKTTYVSTDNKIFRQNLPDQIDFADLFVRSDVFSSSSLLGTGSNLDGALGNNTVVYRSQLVTIPGRINWKSITASAGISTDGDLFSWGGNFYGQVGDGTGNARSVPVQIGTGKKWKQAAKNDRVLAAIDQSGFLYTTGYNKYGQLGLGDAASRNTLTQVGTESNWLTAEVGCLSITATLLAIKKDFTLWGCGYNVSGQLGLNDVTMRSTLVQIYTGRFWKQVSVGNNTVYAIDSQNTLWGAGSNTNGQLGLNDVINRSTPTQIAADKQWKSVAAGSNYALAITTAGELFGWGNNFFGQLGANNTIFRSSPVQVTTNLLWRKVISGGNYSGGISSNGDLYAWGQGVNGNLGLNDTNDRSAPTYVSLGPFVDIGYPMNKGIFVLYPETRQ